MALQNSVRWRILRSVANVGRPARQTVDTSTARPRSGRRRASPVASPPPDPILSLAAAINNVVPPIDRFRPRRPVTVTDLTSSPYCEIQNLFNLTENRGSLFKTAQMKLGSTLHQKLESELFEYDDVKTVTRADWFAVKLWNSVQALQAFASVGKTRELTVFGVIGGQVVTGIVDELTTEPPNPDLELATPEVTDAELGNEDNRPKQIYILETKSRSAPGLPHFKTIDMAFFQLQAYHTLLRDMAFGPDIARAVMDRYGVDPDEALTEELASVLTLTPGRPSPESNPDDRQPPESNPDDRASPESDPDDTPTTPLAIWRAMIDEIKQILPNPTTLSPILTVEYRDVQTNEPIGRRHAIHDESVLQHFAIDKLGMWTGARQAKGVEIEEAYKCQRCKYADICMWRIERAAALAPKRRTGVSATPFTV